MGPVIWDPGRGRNRNRRRNPVPAPSSNPGGDPKVFRGVSWGWGNARGVASLFWGDALLCRAFLPLSGTLSSHTPACLAAPRPPPRLLLPGLAVSDLQPDPSGLPLAPSCSLRQNSSPLRASVSPSRKRRKEQSNMVFFWLKEKGRLFSQVFRLPVAVRVRPPLSHRPLRPGLALPGRFPAGRAWPRGP